VRGTPTFGAMILNRVISWYAKQSHDRPWLILGLNFLWVLALSTLVIMGNHLDFGEEGGESWLIITEDMVTRFDAFGQARSMLPKAVDTVSLERADVKDAATTYFIYTSPNDNMLTPSGLRVMKKVEETYLKHETYPDLCVLNYDDEGNSAGCAPSKSLLSPGTLFNATWDGEKPQYPDLEGVTQEQIDARLLEIVTNPTLRYSFGFYFDQNFGKRCDEVPDMAPGLDCNGFWLKSKYVRSMIEPVGVPILNTRGKGKSAVIDAHMKVLDEEVMDVLGMSGGFLSTPLTSKAEVDDVEIVFMNTLLADRDFGLTVNGDLSWAAASLLAVFAYMAIHTRSLLISTIGMLSVIFSFVLAIFAVKLVFQVQYMDMMLVLIIFVTLGIGADDVFVFVDAFKQSESVPQACGSTLSRLDYTMNRASKAIFVTSLTTMVAFFMTSISDLINIRAFGLYAGMNIFFLFWLTVLMMPPTIVIWENNFSHLPCCVCHSVCLCCGDLREKTRAKRESKQENMAARSSRKIEMPAETPPASMKMDPEAGTTEEDDLIRAKSSLPHSQSAKTFDNQNLGRVERFFYGPYMNFLDKAKYAIVLVFVGLAALGIFFALQLAPPTDSEDFMPPYHMATKFADFMTPSANYWARSDTDVTEDVWIVWGISGMDLSTRSSPWNATDRGTIIWDKSFDPYSMESQTHLLSICPTIRTSACRETTIGCDRSVVEGDDTRWLVRRTPDNPEGQGYCWPTAMQDWLRNQGKDMPMPAQEFKVELRAFYNAHLQKVRTSIGFVEEEDGSLTLKYLAMKFPSSFVAPQSDSITSAVLTDWEEATQALNAAANEGMNNAFMTSGFPFVWLFTQRSLVRNALVGLGLVFAIGFVVITLATMNIVISGVSLLVIAGIILTVLGVGAKGISGWEFGMAESIATVILIGFSMDYCLHLGGAYIESEETTRFLRTRDALVHLGVSVVAGAITTILSGLFLWGTVMIFFQKFAFLITFTVSVSFLWAVIFLPAVLLIIGPEGNFGSLTAIVQCGHKVQPDEEGK